MAALDFPQSKLIAGAKSKRTAHSNALVVGGSSGRGMAKRLMCFSQPVPGLCVLVVGRTGILLEEAFQNRYGVGKIVGEEKILAGVPEPSAPRGLGGRGLGGGLI